ncbi:hypothetical protein GCM10023210_00080 [Chryseobacterium ginsengisoli]|uniref:Uncharacterized protein n=1 Tax=Chryseobacterium ginsengisoli TaxID=363853 RepID=A0ABP9LS35_9FLAO
MNKVFKIGCLIFVLLFIICVVGVTIEKWNNAPTQTIAFLNSSKEIKSVTLERIKENGQLSDTYTVNRTVEPNKTVIEKVPEGNYKVSVWKSDNNLYNSTEYKIKLKNPKESNYQLYRFDLAMDKIYAIVNLNALYEGNSFADYMSNAVGTQHKKLRIEKFYNGGSLFFVPETYTFRTFVDINDEIPTRVKYGEVVYGLYAFPKTLPGNQVQDNLFRQIIDKTK